MPACLSLTAGRRSERPINEVLPPGDVVFDVEITPNRPDGLCHLGLARELAAWFRQDLTYPPGNSPGCRPMRPERRICWKA